MKKKKQKKRKTRHKDVKNSSIRQEKPTHTQQGAQQKKVEQAEGGGGERGKEEKGNVDAAFSLLRFALPNERRSTHKSNAKLHYFVISARPIHCHFSPPPALPLPAARCRA